MEELDKCNDKNREFVCSCSKAYLSYAALFTHIKHKHNGQVHPTLSRPLDPLSGPVPNAKEEDLRNRVPTKMPVSKISKLCLVLGFRVPTKICLISSWK